MPSVACDWDDTLVGYKKYGTPGDWLPGAVDFLKMLRKKRYTIVIHSCRANWPEGKQEITDKLREIGWKESARLKIVEGKPLAVAYIDDRAIGFRGDWSEVDIKDAGRWHTKP